MARGEFELIAQHLTALGAQRADVSLGVGDDAAIVDPTPSAELRCACLCVALVGQTPQHIAEAVEVAFQDLAATLRDNGFTPAWANLALTLPRADDTLVRAMARAVHRACLAHGVAVTGGDTTAGDASLTIFLTGLAKS